MPLRFLIEGPAPSELYFDESPGLVSVPLSKVDLDGKVLTECWPEADLWNLVEDLGHPEFLFVLTEIPIRRNRLLSQGRGSECAQCGTEDVLLRLQPLRHLFAGNLFSDEEILDRTLVCLVDGVVSLPLNLEGGQADEK